MKLHYGIGALLVAGAIFGCRNVEPKADETSNKVLVQLPAVSVEAPTVWQGASRASAAGLQAGWSAELRAVDPIASRAEHPSFDNVWVLQFAADGTALSCQNIGSIGADAPMPYVQLAVAANCKLFVLAGGPASGLNPATWAEFAAMGFDATGRTSSDPQTYCGALASVDVVEQNGVGRILLADGRPPRFVVCPVTSSFRVEVTLNIPGWKTTKLELFQVAKTALYVQPTDAIFPQSAPENFLFTARTYDDQGWACSDFVESSGVAQGSWNVPENARGKVVGIIEESMRNHANAPAYSTCVRVSIESTTETFKKARFFVYLGNNDVTDFTVLRNGQYALAVLIQGTEADLTTFMANDDRVEVKLVP